MGSAPETLSMLGRAMRMIALGVMVLTACGTSVRPQAPGPVATAAPTAAPPIARSADAPQLPTTISYDQTTGRVAYFETGSDSDDGDYWAFVLVDLTDATPPMVIRAFHCDTEPLACRHLLDTARALVTSAFVPVTFQPAAQGQVAPGVHIRFSFPIEVWRDGAESSVRTAGRGDEDYDATFDAAYLPAHDAVVVRWRPVHGGDGARWQRAEAIPIRAEPPNPPFELHFPTDPQALDLVYLAGARRFLFMRQANWGGCTLSVATDADDPEIRVLMEARPCRDTSLALAALMGLRDRLTATDSPVVATATPWPKDAKGRPVRSFQIGSLTAEFEGKHITVRGAGEVRGASVILYGGAPEAVLIAPGAKLWGFLSRNHMWLDISLMGQRF